MEHEGFRRYVRQGITLSTGQTLALDVKMELGAVTETVNVHEESPLVEARTSDVTSLIESRSIADLPLGNRRTLNVIGTTGAAVFVSYGNSRARQPQLQPGRRTHPEPDVLDRWRHRPEHAPGLGQINLDPPGRSRGRNQGSL